MKTLKFALTSFLALILSFSSLFAKSTPVESLHHYELENGLNLFVAENHSVPLSYIEIAVRTGAVDQTPENAGLFHLYEHMMFKGNELYPNAVSIQSALSEMGVANWNGTTGKDHVNYFITVPSSLLEEGLAFWNAAIRTPLMDPKEFENEKKVVISEISGYEVNPGNIYQNYISKTLFPDSAYRNDPSASVRNIQEATIAQLRDIQRRFYIPSNAALFVGGDVDPDATYELVKKIYGTWSNNGNSPSKPHDQPTKTPLDSVKLAVMPFENISPYMAQVSVAFRGPDTDFDIEDTYAADYLAYLISEPDGLFKTKLVAPDSGLGIPQADYVGGGYTTVRTSGSINFSAIMLQPENELPQRALKFLSMVQDEILPEIASDKSLYKKAKVKQIVSIMERDRISSTDTATGLLSALRFWWTATSADYYFSYCKKMGLITQKNVQDFLDEYITGKNALVTILVNPEVYGQTVSAYRDMGFDVIDSNNAYWWRDEKFSPDKEKIALLTDSSSPEKTPVYKPSDGAGQDSSYSKNENIACLRLKNGIPVYVLTDKSKKIDTVAVALKGGISHVDFETSGLESALFDMMAESSVKYNLEARQKLGFETGASLYSNSGISGSALVLKVPDSYLYKTLPVLTDGFINPLYDEKVFANHMTLYYQQIQQTLNDPSSFLMHSVEKSVYEGHPYKVSANVTEESIGNISIDAMRELYSKIITPEDMFVVAVGNINAKKLLAELNKSVGKITSKKSEGEEKISVEIPQLKISGEPVVLSNKNVAGNGYAVRVFAAPPMTSPDSIVASLVNNIYSEILYNVVRERRGICYTPLSTGSISRASFGMEVLINLTDYANFSGAVSEARNMMSEGKVITGVNESGEYEFVSLEECLESYKNKYINESFSSLASSGGKTSVLVNNLMDYDDLYHDHKEIQILKTITADDVLRVFKKYWVDESSRWFAIVGPGDEGKLNFSGR